MHAHTIYYNNTTAAADSLRSLPPRLNLGGSLCLRLAVGKTARARLGSNDEHNVMTQPGLHVGNDAAVVAAQGLLKIDDFGLEVAQDVDVAVGGCERKDHGFLFDEAQSLRVNCVESGVGSTQAAIG